MGSIEDYWKYKYRKCWRRLYTLFVLLVVATVALSFHMQHHDGFLFVDLSAVVLIISLMDKVARRINSLNNKRPPGI